MCRIQVSFDDGDEKLIVSLFSNGLLDEVHFSWRTANWPGKLARDQASFMKCLSAVGGSTVFIKGRTGGR